MVERFRHKIALTAVIILTVILATSCYVTQDSSDTKDLSYIYNPIKNVFSPYFSVFSEDAETVILSVRLRRGEIYFNEANPEGVPMASILISVRLFDNTQGGGLADTAKLKFDLPREQVTGEYVCRIPLKAYEGKSYSAEVKIIDLIRQRTVQSFVDFERTGPYNRLNFKIRDHFSGNEIHANTLREGEFINILYPSRPVDTLWLFYYKAVNAIPPAPSVILPEVTATDEPDKIIPLPYSDTMPVMFPRQGIYLISVDSTIREGLTLFNFGSDHPSMSKPETMIPPLAYIATREEMDSMRAAAKPKVALDEFWLQRTGSIERSKELIRIYYNRTLFANYYFTSYKAGWLTDRGMIYIIYGPPDKVYKNAEGESWGYKKPPVKSRWGSRFTPEEKYLWFNFRKQKSLFTDNDYTLNRATTPVSYWDIAVARWREGKVFRLDNPAELQ
ncbi:MAG TPA: GWxTD domain-containing protein [Bacteroidales bacterium]|nr:GWxTD domain-containing protein [Bacteroidales bacterium]